VIDGCYPWQDWLTFLRALAAGGCVNKGERGQTVFYPDRFTPEAEKQRSAEQGGDARSIPFLKRFVVFNVAQCDGLPERLGEGKTWTMASDCHIQPLALNPLAQNVRLDTTGTHSEPQAGDDTIGQLNLTRSWRLQFCDLSVRQTYFVRHMYLLP
jgi:hypothetical protein